MGGECEFSPGTERRRLLREVLSSTVPDRERVRMIWGEADLDPARFPDGRAADLLWEAVLDAAQCEGTDPLRRLLRSIQRHYPENTELATLCEEELQALVQSAEVGVAEPMDLSRVEELTRTLQWPAALAHVDDLLERCYNERDRLRCLFKKLHLLRLLQKTEPATHVLRQAELLQERLADAGLSATWQRYSALQRMATGELTGPLEVGQRAAAIHWRLGMIEEWARDILLQGMVLTRTHRFAAAARLYMRALRDAEGRLPNELRAELYFGRGRCLHELGECQMATVLLKRAEEAAQAASSAWLDLRIEEELALIDLEEGRYQSAMDRLRQALFMVERIGVPFLEAPFYVSLGRALMECGQLDQAQAHLVKGRDLSLEHPRARGEALLALGELNLARGDEQGVQTALSALDACMAANPSQPDAEVMAGRHLLAARRHQKLGDREAAAAELSRAVAVMVEVAGRQPQNLQHRVSNRPRYRRLREFLVEFQLSVGEDPADGGLSRVWGHHHPGLLGMTAWADLTPVGDARPGGAAELVASLCEGEALLCYTSLEGRLLVHFVTSQGVKRCEVEVSQATLRKEMLLFRQSLSGNEDGARQCLGHLGDALLPQKVQRWIRSLAQDSVLVVILDQVLQGLPFAALNSPRRAAELDFRPLLLDYCVVMVPSLSWVRDTLKSRPQPQRGFRIIADPHDQLKHVAVETYLLQLYLGRAEVLRGQRATPSALEQGPPTRFLHLKVGRRASSPEEVLGIPLAPERVQTEGSSVEATTPGLVDAERIAGTKLSCEVVTLMLCEVKQDEEEEENGEWVQVSEHLPLALLVAGARAVVSTVWLSPEWLSLIFVGHFYESLMSGNCRSRVHAFTSAQRRLLSGVEGDGSGIGQRWISGYDGGKIDVTSLSCWAGFQFTGDWRCSIDHGVSG